MGESSKIEWTHHTFNPWWGCQRVSPGCEHCYAEAWAKRTGNQVWGPTAPRRFFGEKHWAEPLKWNRAAEKAGERRRVFCASMADVFEDRRDLDEWREKLWVVIDQTPWLDWLLLTKRPENLRLFGSDVLSKCWIGTTTEDQRRFDERVEHLLSVDAAVHFLSCEPLLGSITIPPKYFGATDSLAASFGNQLVNWVIVGSESGPGARPMDIQWAESLRNQCEEAGVSFFTKQIANKSDRKGGKPEFWPGGPWPREFPEVGHV